MPFLHAFQSDLVFFLTPYRSSSFSLHSLWPFAEDAKRKTRLGIFVGERQLSFFYPLIGFRLPVKQWSLPIVQWKPLGEQWFFRVYSAKKTQKRPIVFGIPEPWKLRTSFPDHWAPRQYSWSFPTPHKDKRPDSHFVGRPYTPPYTQA